MRHWLIWLVARPFVFLVYLFAHSPQRLRHVFGDFLGLLWFDVFRIRRKLVLDNLKRAFPDWPESQRRAVGRKSVCHMGRNLTEYTLVPWLTSETYQSLFSYHGVEHLEAAREKGRGVCLLTLHLGNGDFAVAGLALRGVPITLISKEFKWKWLNQVWFGLRRKMGTKFIPPRNSSYGILKALKAKENVAFVLDQFMGPPIGVKTTFFGHPTGTALGLAMMAQRSEAPVVPVYTYRDTDGITQIFFEREIPPVQGDDRDEVLRLMTQSYNDCLERLVRLRPDQWMWVHNRWKPFRE